MYPSKPIPVVKHVCKIHGDPRFNYLSSTENKAQDDKVKNRISYAQFMDKMKLIRWKNCRRCNGIFEQADVQCSMTWFWVKESAISMRRSFILHDDCMKRELAFLQKRIQKVSVDSTLDAVM